jgi:hypothetical protein
MQRPVPETLLKEIRANLFNPRHLRFYLLASPLPAPCSRQRLSRRTLRKQWLPSNATSRVGDVAKKRKIVFIKKSVQIRSIRVICVSIFLPHPSPLLVPGNISRG